MDQTTKTDDLAAQKVWQLLIWTLPQFLFVVGVVAGLAEMYLFQQVVWIVALLIIGTGCTVNAWRCGRVHCYFSGPFLLLAALFVFLKSIQVMTLHWGWLAAGIPLVSTLMNYLSEHYLGKYR